MKSWAAGIDVVRLNFSHGSLADHRQRVDALRLAMRCLPADRRRHGRPAGVPRSVSASSLAARFCSSLTRTSSSPPTASLAI
ncbi:MAG: hypothetical protein IPJ52_13675 [Rhodocyclaceae bacterium]|nr:hypothetical protein [Rhodocyclaceae bacterium]